MPKPKRRRLKHWQRKKSAGSGDVVGDVVSVLRSQLKSRNPEKRVEAVRKVFYSIKAAKELLPELLGITLKDPSPDCRHAAVTNLAGFAAGGFKDKRMVPVLAKALRDKSPGVRLQAASALEHFSKKEFHDKKLLSQAVADLKKMLKEKGPTGDIAIAALKKLQAK